MVKRYILFVYDNDAPYGGPCDIVAHADTPEEAEVLAHAHLREERLTWGGRVADIYDCQGQDVVETRGGDYPNDRWTVLKDWKRRT